MYFGGSSGTCLPKKHSTHLSTFARGTSSWVMSPFSSTSSSWKISINEGSALATGSIKPGYTREENALNEATETSTLLHMSTESREPAQEVLEKNNSTWNKQTPLTSGPRGSNRVTESKCVNYHRTVLGMVAMTQVARLYQSYIQKSSQNHGLSPLLLWSSSSTSIVPPPPPLPRSSWHFRQEWPSRGSSIQ